MPFRSAPPSKGSKQKWMARWEADRRLPVRSHPPARRGLRDRHAAADGQRLAARRPRLLVHAHRRRSRASSGCAARPCSIRWDGTTTACRPSAACRTTTACAAIRRCPYDPAFQPPDKPRQAADLGLASELHRAVHRADGRRREGVRGAVALSRPLGRLGDDLRHDRPARAARVAGRVPAPAARRATRTSSKRRRCGTSTSGPRWRRRSSRIASSRARITASGSRASTARVNWRRSGVEIETTRPELIPACVALVAHPDDERYKPLFGTRRA